MAPHSDEALDGVVQDHISTANGSSNGNGTTLTNGAALSNGNPLNGASTNGHTNGHATSNGASNPAPAPAHSSPSPIDDSTASIFPASDDSEAPYDLVCVGFGPASLSIAIAIHDALASSTTSSRKALNSPIFPDGRPPRVLFLEKQGQFAWHAGMLLPGAKMQISFLKDLASLRNPRSRFTFLNYVHEADRLIDFINLNTFLPSRVEFEDYLRWCSSHFSHLVQYNREVVSVTPDAEVIAEGAVASSSPVNSFTVRSRNSKTGHVTEHRARNVLLALGGQPRIPKVLVDAQSPRIIHSSQYAQAMPKLLNRGPEYPYRVAVVGAGQSAAEIFNNVQTLYPNSKTSMIMRTEFMRPSDDSPFINSIFNPAFIDDLHSRSRQARATLLHDAKATNYSVVRLELIELIYERMYDQRRSLGADETLWPHRILSRRELVSIESLGEDGLRLHLRPVEEEGAEEEILDVDVVVSATGYQRNAHLQMLQGTFGLLPADGEEAQAAGEGWQVETGGKEDAPRRLRVARNYKVQFENGRVGEKSGVWLQGCCEGTHGLSDTLLSVLASRSGEIVNSIFA